jgi:hypothetical protein
MSKNVIVYAGSDGNIDDAFEPLIEHLHHLLSHDLYDSVVIDLKGDYPRKTASEIIVCISVFGQPLIEQVFKYPKSAIPLSAWLTLHHPSRKPFEYGPIEVRKSIELPDTAWVALICAISYHCAFALRFYLNKHAAPTTINEKPQNIRLSARHHTPNIVGSKMTQRAHWTIGLGNHKFLPLRKAGIAFQESEVQWLTPPKDRFWADPFLLKSEDKTYLLFEELYFHEGFGRLVYADISNTLDVKSSSIEPIEFSPATSTHLSFPFTFSYRDNFYCVPETQASGATKLYRCTTVPNHWVFVRDLLPTVRGADPVLLEHDNTLWLFVSDAALSNQDNHLRLFFADDIDAEFVEHPCSPIKLGLDGCRMAGPIIKYEGNLLRPSQNCSIRYGQSLTLHKITTLNRTQYAEEAFSQIRPDHRSKWNWALHSLCVLEDHSLIAIDAAACIR